MLKQFFPSICPECGLKLSIELGKSGTYKLTCINDDCKGQDFKKFEKGVLSLQIRNLGPATIKSLYDAGITSIEMLFDKNFLNTEFLVESMMFKEGRALEKIIDSVYNTKEIQIQRMIESLQFDNIGTSFSIQIGKMLSNVAYSFSGYSLEVRDDLANKQHSKILQKINDIIKLFEDNDIKIIYYQENKSTTLKTLKDKKVDFVGNIQVYDFLTSLNYDVVDLKSEDCDFLIIENKDIKDEKIDIAKMKNIKILTFNQAKILLK